MPAGVPEAHVIQVNVSPGGVPKLPVDRAWVGPHGLVGDAHRDHTVHGGPHRAVALFAIEAIRRVSVEGHPIFPGSAGENLTTEGIEWASLPVGTRFAVGPALVLELSKPDNPCETIQGSFSDERFGRISILAHPTDSRMYARVIVEGEVRPGDEIRLLPPAPDSEAELHALLDRVDAANRGADVALWRAAADAGFDVRYVDDGDLAMVASPGLPGPWFNRAIGYRELPNLLPRMLDWFREHDTVGYIEANRAPWPGASSEAPATTLIGALDDGAGAAPAAPSHATRGLSIKGLAIQEAGPADIETVRRIVRQAGELDPVIRPAWDAAISRLQGTAGQHFYLARLDGTPVGVGRLAVRRKVGVLRSAVVIPAARGRGIQRALIAHRAAAAVEEFECTLLAASATDDSVSRRNLEASGLRPVWPWAAYRFDPEG